MAHVVFGYGFAFLTATCVIVGDYFIKVAADDDRSLTSGIFLLGAAFYVASACGWYGSMRNITLAQAGVAYSMLTLLAVCALGVLAFGEKLHLREALGIGCALLSMVLMVRFV